VARRAAAVAEEKKAMSIMVLDLRKVTLIADYFVLCSARSDVHAKSIADGIKERLSEATVDLRHREGYERGRWILLDYGSVVVHIMQEYERDFYNLEGLWGDAPILSLEAEGSTR